VQLCLLVSHPAEYLVLAIKAGTVWQIRPDTHQGSVQQPVHVKDLRLLIGPVQDGLDGVLVQAVLGCFLPNQQPIRMQALLNWQAGPKQADCHDAKGLSEGHEFAHKQFGVVGVPVLGAEAPGQLVLQSHAA
jgi:hypothetical protein